MEKTRKIECDCGKTFQERQTELEGGIVSEALVCPGCERVTLRPDQALKYFNLRQMKEDLNQERKIIQVGNSIGITFPEAVKNYGFKKGNKVKLEAIDEKSFKISIA